MIPHHGPRGQELTQLHEEARAHHRGYERNEPEYHHRTDGAGVTGEDGMAAEVLHGQPVGKQRGDHRVRNGPAVARDAQMTTHVRHGAERCVVRGCERGGHTGTCHRGSTAGHHAADGCTNRAARLENCRLAPERRPGHARNERGETAHQGAGQRDLRILSTGSAGHNRETHTAGVLSLRPVVQYAREKNAERDGDEGYDAVGSLDPLHGVLLVVQELDHGEEGLAEEMRELGCHSRHQQHRKQSRCLTTDSSHCGRPGTCWVMQWIPPPHSNTGRASMRTI